METTNHKIKDRRYKSVLRLLEGGDIKTFTEIFDYLPRSILVNDLRQNYSTFTSKIIHPHRFTLFDLFSVSYWLEVEPEKLITLLKAEVVASIARRKKPSVLKSDK
jgi:hypothetical protein